jgi:uncharacterized LabA/DUF88 family protein
MVFIDGQNLYKGCATNFGHPYCHPLLLARHLAGNRRLVGVRYYSGLHDPRVNRELNARLQRRHALMRKTRVTVVERVLSYRWEWGFDKNQLPDPKKNIGVTQQVTVSPYQRAREKGIDVALALDVIDLAQQKQMDVAVIVSSDTDLCEVARVVHSTTGIAGKRVSVEAAVVSGRRPVLLQHYDYTHNLNRNDFQQFSDNFDYDSELPAGNVHAFVDSCHSSARQGCI